MEKIVRATPFDIPAINRLVNAAYRGASSKFGWTTEADLLDGTRIDEDALHDLIARADTVVLLYRGDDALLGCVELREENQKLYLGMLAVDPQTQGQGVGKKLLVAAEKYAQTKGIKTILMTVISLRTELITWYVRHNYRLTGEKKPFIVPDSRWGIPKLPLEFVVLEKSIP